MARRGSVSGSTTSLNKVNGTPQKSTSSLVNGGAGMKKTLSNSSVADKGAKAPKVLNSAAR
jgi:hypothetical protein